MDKHLHPEIRAVSMVLTAFQERIIGQTLNLMTGYATVMAQEILRVDGGSCNRDPHKIHSGQEKHSGKSTKLPQTDYYHRRVTLSLSVPGNLHGLQEPHGDLFATQRNANLPIYVSPVPDHIPFIIYGTGWK